MEVKHLNCCGLVEISGIGGFGSPESQILELIQGVGGKPSHVRSGVIFTSANRSKTEPAPYAERFKEYIEANNLGTVQVMSSFRNKNSGNYIISYLWTVRPRALSTWFKAR